MLSLSKYAPRLDLVKLGLFPYATVSATRQVSPGHTDSPSTSSVVPLRGRRPRITPGSNVRVSNPNFARRQRADEERMRIFQKHFGVLTAKEITSIYDLIDMIEWSNYTSGRQTSELMNFVASPSCNVGALSDREMAVVVRGAGLACIFHKPQQRLAMLDKLVNTLNRRGIRLGVEARNMLIECWVKNGKEFSVASVLKWFADGEVEPDERTYSILAKAYANKGDAPGVLEIVNYVKGQGMPVASLLESVVYALALGGQDRHAKTIIESSSKEGTSEKEAKLRVAFACAKARNSDVDALVEIIESASAALDWQNGDNAVLLLEPLLMVAVQGSDETMQKIARFFPLEELGGKVTARRYVEPILMKVRECLFADKNNIQAAVSLMNLLPRDRTLKLEEVLLSNFKQMFVERTNVNTLISGGVALGKAGLVSNPMQTAVDLALAYNHDNFYALYEAFLSSDECAKLGDRPHLLLPRCTYLAAKARRLQDSDEKAKVFAEIGKLLFDAKEDITPDFKRVCLIDPLLKSEKALPSAIRLMQKDVGNFVATGLVERLLFFGNAQAISKLLDGPLKDASIALQFVKNLLCKLFITSDRHELLKVSTRLMAMNCRFTNGRRGLGTASVIEEVLLAQKLSMEKANRLVKMWNDDGGIEISPAQMKNIEGKLRGAGLEQRIPLLKSIKKTSGLERWRNTDDIKLLETEAEYIANNANLSAAAKSEALGSLLRVILDKRLKEKPIVLKSLLWVLRTILESKALMPSFKEHFMSAFDVVMREALLTNQLDIANEAWSLGRTLMSTGAKIGYAFALREQKNQLDSERVIRSIMPQMTPISAKELSKFGVTQSIETLHFLKDIAKKLKFGGREKAILFRGCYESCLKDFIDRGELEKGLSLASDAAMELGSAFGQFELMGAALDTGDIKLLQKVTSMVEYKHDKNVAMLNLGLVLLEKSRNEQAAKIFGANGLHITTEQLRYFVQREVAFNRPDVLVGLFTNLLSDEGKAAMVDLRNVLICALNLYGNAGDAEGVDAVMKEVNRTCFPVDETLRSHMDRCVSWLERQRASNPAPGPPNAILDPSRVAPDPSNAVFDPSSVVPEPSLS